MVPVDFSSSNPLSNTGLLLDSMGKLYISMKTEGRLDTAGQWTIEFGIFTYIQVLMNFIDSV